MADKIERGRAWQHPSPLGGTVLGPEIQFGCGDERTLQGADMVKGEKEGNLPRRPGKPGSAGDDLRGSQGGTYMARGRHFGWPYSVDLSTQLDISLPISFNKIGEGYKILDVCCQILDGFGNYKGGNKKNQSVFSSRGSTCGL